MSCSAIRGAVLVVFYKARTFPAFLVPLEACLMRGVRPLLLLSDSILDLTTLVSYWIAPRPSAAAHFALPVLTEGTCSFTP